MEPFQAAKPIYTSPAIQGFYAVCCFWTNSDTDNCIECNEWGFYIMGFIFQCNFNVEYIWRISVKRGQIQNVRTISLGLQFRSQLGNEASFLSLWKVEVWCANSASVPPPGPVISSQRWHIRSAPGRRREWTCSGWMSARWQPQKLWMNSTLGLFVRIIIKAGSHSSRYVAASASKRVKHSISYKKYPIQCSTVWFFTTGWKKRHT